jgi:sodium/proline symporter
MTIALPTLITFALYMLFLIGVGLWHSKQSSNSVEDYILGGRQMGPTVTALSVNASDMSSWLLMALPGAVCIQGASQAFIGIGLIIGAWLNWTMVAKRLRVYTQFANNALTIPSFLEQRFHDRSGAIRLVSALTIIVFFTFYISAGMYSGALLFQEILNISYVQALLIGASIIVLYTFVGGFLAVSWTDFFQGCLMLFALMIVPTMIFAQPEYALTKLEPEFLSLWPENATWISVASALAWGLGYFGQPHILSRFMAIKSAADISLSKRIAIGWLALALGSAIATGLAGAIYYQGQMIDNPESIFIYLAQALFSPWLAGILIAAILSAIMSSIDSQLLVCTSVVTEDLYKKWLRPQASEKEMMLLNRAGIVLISILAILLSLDPNASILVLVSYAWAGFGAAFGSAILLALFWKKYTRNGVIASMITGALTVIVWKTLEGGIFELYEMLPGFVIALISGMLVSLLSPNQNPKVEQEFTEFEAQLNP